MEWLPEARYGCLRQNQREKNRSSGLSVMSLNFVEPQFSHLLNKDNNIIPGLSRELSATAPEDSM